MPHTAHRLFGRLVVEQRHSRRFVRLSASVAHAVLPFPVRSARSTLNALSHHTDWAWVVGVLTIRIIPGRILAAMLTGAVNIAVFAAFSLLLRPPIHCDRRIQAYS